MKKLLSSIVFLFFVCTLFSQEKVDLIKGVRSLDFYGVDFSSARALGVNETSQQFATAFGAINMLLVDEYNKYNLEKFLSKDDVALHLEHLNPSYGKIVTNEDFKIYDDGYTIDINKIKSLIQGYDVDFKYEVGAVMIAELLNKRDGYATYHFVFFDNDSKNIIASYPLKCKIGGFGLRNFWAKSVYNAMKGIEKSIRAGEHNNLDDLYR